MSTNAGPQRRTLSGAILCALALSGLVHAGPNAWTSSTPYGADVRALAIDPVTPAALYAGTFGAGIFRSTDAGGTWAGANTGLATLDIIALAAHPTTPGTLYAGTRAAGVFKSTNAGATWAAANNGLTGFLGPNGMRGTSLSIDPATPATLYFAAADLYGGVYKSTDSGGTWSNHSTGIAGLTSVCSLAIDPSAATTVYAGSCQGDGLFKSTNGGASWALASPSLSGQGSIPALAVNPATSSTLLAATQEEGVFKSTDSGATWVPSDTGLTNPNVRGLVVDSANPTIAYAANVTGGVFKSTNTGATWMAMNTDLTTTTVNTLVVNAATPSTLYAGAEGGVFKSTNSGGAWGNASAGLTNLSFKALAVDPSNPATIYAGGGPVGVYEVTPPPGFELFRSTDAGGTWVQANDGLPNREVRALVIDPATSTTVYAGTDADGVFKSSNSGDTWSLVDNGLPAGWLYRQVSSLVIDPTAPATLYAGTAGGFCRSTDSGGTWAVLNAGLTNVSVSALAIDPSAPSTIYAGTYGTGVFRSTNSGSTWVAANSGIASAHVYALVVDSAHPATLYAGGPGGGAVVFKSTNSGASWAPASTGLPSGGVRALVVTPLGDTLYAGSVSAGVFRSTDSGGTWFSVGRGLPASKAINALALDVTGATTLYASLRGNGVWQATPPPPAFVKGDFDGDDRPDLVFRSNLDPSQNKAWLMNGVARTTESPITPDAANADWKIRGVDDFDGDGRNDLVLWNQATGNVEFWALNGTTRLGASMALAGGVVLGTDWDLSATADFDRDGRPDIVWRNLVTQKIAIWRMGGIAQIGEITPTPDRAVDGNWIVVAALDYNNDGNADLLWYNQTSGKLVSWYLNGSVVRTSGQFAVPSGAGNSNWKVVASSDYSGTFVPGTPPLGSPDIVWRNETSGNQVVWHMDFASTRVHGEFTSPVANSPALDWSIVGPR